MYRLSSDNDVISLISTFRNTSRGYDRFARELCFRPQTTTRREDKGVLRRTRGHTVAGILFVPALCIAMTVGHVKTGARN